MGLGKTLQSICIMAADYHNMLKKFKVFIQYFNDDNVINSTGKLNALLYITLYKSSRGGVGVETLSQMTIVMIQFKVTREFVYKWRNLMNKQEFHEKHKISLSRKRVRYVL